MDKKQMREKIDELEQNFLSTLAHPDGERITRAAMDRTQCVSSGDRCIVFKNEDDKHIVIAFAQPPQGLRVVNARKFLSRDDISTSYIEDLIGWIILDNDNLSVDEKSDLLEFVPTWMTSRSSSLENVQKITTYNLLKQDLEDKGLI